MPERKRPFPMDLPRSKMPWLPIVVGILLCALTFALWKTLDAQERANLQAKVKFSADYLASHVEADLRNRLPALSRIVRTWELNRGMSKEAFVEDAGSYLADVPGFQAIEWVDPGFVVRWIVPFKGNEKALNLYLAFEENRRATLEKARDGRRPAATSPIDLVQGGKGFLAFFPFFIGDRFGGYVLGVFRIQEWLDYVFRVKESTEVPEDFRISVSFDGLTVYERKSAESGSVAGLASSARTTVMDHELGIVLQPTSAFIAKNRTPLPFLTSVIGVLLSFLIALIVGLFQRANVDTRRAEAARAALETEIHQREKVELMLQTSLVRIELATEAGHIGTWTWDLESNSLAWNEYMYALFGFPSDQMPTYELWRRSLHPDDRERTENLLDKAVKEGAVFDTEFRIILASGEIRNIRSAAHVIREAGNKARYVTGLNWDVTETRRSEIALRKSEEQVRLLLDSTGEAIYGIDLEGNCTFANASCLRMLGYADKRDLLGRNMHELIHHSWPDGRPMDQRDCRIFKAFKEGLEVRVDTEVLWRADGSSFPAEYWSYPQRVGGETYGAVVTFIDITERKRAEEQLATERRRLSFILEGTNAGTWEWKVPTGELVLNERWAGIIGYRLEELEPITIDTWIKLAHPEDLKTSDDLLAKHFRGELDYYECELRMLHKNGTWIWVLDRGKVATWASDGSPLLMSGTHQDITGRKATEETIRHMATHDGLTDLPSLRLGRDRLAMAIGMAHRYRTLVAVMFVDLDGFKEVNDRLGHDAGDEVLKEVAKRLTAVVRETDTVARIGGDEFLLIITELSDREAAARIAEKLISVVSKPFLLAEASVNVGASVGIAIFPEDGEHMEQLIKRADEAMYRVKTSGKNDFFFAKKT
jgi:diguanylate cyclase (GGDEF)-like protein/PAS domain S-box-containing protein